MSYVEKPEDISWNVQNLAEVDEDLQVIELRHYQELYNKYQVLLDASVTLKDSVLSVTRR